MGNNNSPEKQVLKSCPQTPKTSLCCGLKPKRTFIQTGFRDDEGFFELCCRKKCGNKVSIENNSRGTSKVETSAVELWNNLVWNHRSKENEEGL